MFSSLGVCSVNSYSGGYRVLVCCARSHGQPRSAESSSEAKLFALDPVDWKPWQWVEEGKSGRDVQGVWLIHTLGTDVAAVSGQLALTLIVTHSLFLLCKAGGEDTRCHF